MSDIKNTIKVEVPLIDKRYNGVNAYDTFKARLFKNQFPKPHYLPRDIEQFKAVDNIHALVWYDENALSYEEDRLVFKCHKHCIIYSEGVYDTETNKVYDFIEVLKTFFGLTFPQACYVAKTFLETVNHQSVRAYCELKYPNAKKSSLSSDHNLNTIKTENLFLKENNNSYKTGYAVLHNRFGIDRNIVSNFIHREYLIMDNQYNLCFLTYEKDNVISVLKYLSDNNYIATETQDKHRNAGFRYAIKEEADYNMFRNVYVFENVVDLMSYLTLVKMGLVPEIEKASCLLSINGISNGVLHNFLSEHPEVLTIYACLQNDSAGLKATKNISQRVMVNMQPILRDYSLKNSYVQTWNAMLQYELHKQS